MKTKIYEQIISELPHYWTDYNLTNLSQTAAIIYQTLPGLNWVGFYLKKGNQLRLGPFQGKPACMDIEMGRGVCGTAAKLRQTMIVPDVHQFADHITCDSASNSEIVVPIIDKGEVLGVLDLDSPHFSHFDYLDAQSLEKIVSLLILKTSFKN
jgi:L-methionine (R)-S-oxide reductase